MMVLKIAGGIVLAVILLMVGCSALIATGGDEVDKAIADIAQPAPEEEVSGETASQENARGSAESYLEIGSFSRQGLIEQLSSDAGEGFSKADAVYAVDYMNVDWNEQAAKSAKSYLENGSFSRQGLIEQLSSDAGEGFTHEQAVYGVNQTGL